MVLKIKFFTSDGKTLIDEIQGKDAEFLVEASSFLEVFMDDAPINNEGYFNVITPISSKREIEIFQHFLKGEPLVMNMPLNSEEQLNWNKEMLFGRKVAIPVKDITTNDVFTALSWLQIKPEYTETFFPSHPPLAIERQRRENFVERLVNTRKRAMNAKHQKALRKIARNRSRKQRRIQRGRYYNSNNNHGYTSNNSNYNNNNTRKFNALMKKTEDMTSAQFEKFIRNKLPKPSNKSVLINTNYNYMNDIMKNL